METLNSKIKIIAVEATASSRYLLATDDMQGLCLQVVDHDTECIPEDILISVGQAITFNCFNEIICEESNGNVRQYLTNKLSHISIKKIHEIFNLELLSDSKVVVEEFDELIQNIILFKPHLDITSWDSISLDFGDKNSTDVNSYIKKQIGDKNGFYAIFKNEKCLYIGVGKKIYYRVQSHYKAAQGREKELRWSIFFQQYNSKITVYFKNFNFSLNDRVDFKSKMLIESFLEQKYKPEFEFNYDRKSKSY